MTPTITAFERSPDRGKGLARDMRVRWALEEVGQPYDVRLLSFSEMKDYRSCDAPAGVSATIYPAGRSKSRDFPNPS